MNSQNLNSLYLAVTARLIALNQVLLLGGSHGVPLINEVTQGDMHRPISLQFPYNELKTQDKM